MTQPTIYIASKTKHAKQWIKLRESGVNFISTWIDEAGQGESTDLNDLYRRCVKECQSCDAMIVYREDGDYLKGAFIEMGIAITRKIPILLVGDVLTDQSVFTTTGYIFTADTVEKAVEAINRNHRPAATQDAETDGLNIRFKIERYNGELDLLELLIGAGNDDVEILFNGEMRRLKDYKEAITHVRDVLAKRLKSPMPVKQPAPREAVEGNVNIDQAWEDYYRGWQASAGQGSIDEYDFKAGYRAASQPSLAPKGADSAGVDGNKLVRGDMFKKHDGGKYWALALGAFQWLTYWSSSKVFTNEKGDRLNPIDVFIHLDAQQSPSFTPSEKAEALEREGREELEGAGVVGVSMIAQERRRQIEVERWDYSHDADYNHGQLIGAAACYVMNALAKHGYETRAEFRKDKDDSWSDAWPWDAEWDKRKKHGKLRSLVIAGALIAAEIDRMNPTHQNTKIEGK